MPANTLFSKSLFIFAVGVTSIPYTQCQTMSAFLETTARSPDTVDLGSGHGLPTACSDARNRGIAQATELRICPASRLAFRFPADRRTRLGHGTGKDNRTSAAEEPRRGARVLLLRRTGIEGIWTP